MSGKPTSDQELAAAEALQNFFIALQPWIPTIIITLIIFYAGGAFVMGRVFKKAGEPEWSGWVPIYSFWVYYKLGNQPPWIVILMLIPYIGMLFSLFLIPATYNINKNFGKSQPYLLMAYFLPVLWLGMLAFGDAKWQSEPVQKTNKLRKEHSS